MILLIESHEPADLPCRPEQPLTFEVIPRDSVAAASNIERIGEIHPVTGAARVLELEPKHVAVTEGRIPAVDLVVQRLKERPDASCWTELPRHHRRADPQKLVADGYAAAYGRMRVVVHV